MTACREVFFVMFPYIPVAKQSYDIVKLCNKKKYTHAAIYGGGMFVCLITGITLSIVYAPDIHDAFYTAGADVDNVTAISNETKTNFKDAADFFTVVSLTWMVTTGTRIGGFVANMAATFGGALVNCCSVL